MTNPDMNIQAPRKPKIIQSSEPDFEYVITHASTQADSGTHMSQLVPPKGHGWRPIHFCASHHSTHILWSRVKEQG